MSSSRAKSPPWKHGSGKPSHVPHEDGAEPLYPNYLRGYGNQPLKKPRALRGSKLGPANQGRSLSPDEVAAVAAKLRQEGKL